MISKNVADRFWSKVDKSGECWVWTGAHDGPGYGSFRLNGHTVRAHRAAWLLEVGPIPDGQYVMHSCDNPPCVRIDHLSIGSAFANMQDCVSKRRHTSKITKGEYAQRGRAHHSAKLTEEQIVEIRRRADNCETFGSIAVSLGVSRSTIGKIVNGVAWQHAYGDQVRGLEQRLAQAEQDRDAAEARVRVLEEALRSVLECESPKDMYDVAREALGESR